MAEIHIGREIRPGHLVDATIECTFGVSGTTLEIRGTERQSIVLFLDTEETARIASHAATTTQLAVSDLLKE